MEADAAQAELTDEVGRDLVTIRRQAERISRVTRSILTFSRGTVSTLKPLDLNWSPAPAWRWLVNGSQGVPCGSMRN